MVSAVCRVLVGDDRTKCGMYCSLDGRKRQTHSTTQTPFFPSSHIPLRSYHPASLNVCERCVYQGCQLFTNPGTDACHVGQGTPMCDKSMQSLFMVNLVSEYMDDRLSPPYVI